MLVRNREDRAIEQPDNSAPWTPAEIEADLQQARIEELGDLRDFHGRVARILAMTLPDERAPGVRVYKIPPNDVLLDEIARLKALDSPPSTD
jgi:hypothetical protein